MTEVIATDASWRQRLYAVAASTDAPKNAYAHRRGLIGRRIDARRDGFMKRDAGGGFDKTVGDVSNSPDCAR